MVEVHFEVLAQLNGRWQIVMVSDDEASAVKEALRWIRKTPSLHVRVSRERYDSDTHLIRGRTVFRHEPSSAGGHRLTSHGARA